MPKKITLAVILILMLSHTGSESIRAEQPFQSKPKKVKKKDTSSINTQDPKPYSNTTESPFPIYQDSTKKSSKPSAKKTTIKRKKK